LIAIADQGRVQAGGTPLTGYTQTLPALYSLPAADYHDILHGNNGDPAGPGFDLATGLGTPVANLLVPDLAGYQTATRMAIKAEPPPRVVVGDTFGLTVQVQDSLGNAVTCGNVTVALGANPGDAILGGTLTAAVENGLATFSDLTLSEPGTGYTLTVTTTGIASAQTTTPITVTTGSNVTKIDVMASPAMPVVGQALTLTAAVSVVSPGTGVPTKTVTFKQGTVVLGTPTLSNGIATVAITPTAAGTEVITVAYGGDADNQPSNAVLPLSVGQGKASLNLGGLSVTYDGSVQHALVTTNPAGLSGVSVIYSQSGVAVVDPIHAGTYIVVASLNNRNYTAPAATGTLVIAKSTPGIVWSVPANITIGTPLGASQLDALASFNGRPLAGTLTYAPPVGTVLPLGSGQALTVTFVPSDGTDFKSVTASVPINVLPQATQNPPQALVKSAQPVFKRKLNTRGKAVGKAVLTGFELDFNMPLDSAAISNPSNYQLDTVATKRVKRKLERVLQPIKRIIVGYTPARDSVTLKLVGLRSFPLGGQLTVLSGVTSGSGSVLIGTTVFTITPGGKKIEPS
jgi:hypothetical protein